MTCDCKSSLCLWQGELKRDTTLKSLAVINDWWISLMQDTWPCLHQRKSRIWNQYEMVIIICFSSFYISIFFHLDNQLHQLTIRSRILKIYFRTRFRIHLHNIRTIKKSQDKGNAKCGISPHLKIWPNQYGSRFS